MPKFLSLAGVLLLAGLVLGSAPASAHSALVSTDPSDGARLDAMPSVVSLTFNEVVAIPAFVSITAPDGTKVKTHNVEVVDKSVTASVAPAGMRGIFTMSYRVVSSDGHPVEGSTTFQVTTGATVDQVEPKAQGSFVHRHRSHLVWGLLGAVLAIGLLLWPLRKARS